MNIIKNIYDQLNPILRVFEPISLQEMDDITLMNRTDTKFVFNAELLRNIIEKAIPFYRILEINQQRQFLYTTTYFDTPQFSLYYDHHNGRLNRYKIRQRRYDITGVEYFEIKFKNNKGRTIKSRVKNNSENPLNEKADSFLRKKTPYDISQLQKILNNNFYRITLVNKQKTERITLDYGLAFQNSHYAIEYPNIGIIEIKRDKISSQSELTKILHQLRIYPDGISKYCFGVVSLYNDKVRINQFKPKLLKIKHLY